ncbi:unnamed protein product [Cuscuta campestris]|uniref:Pentacotripeptide-repeat region of PRORP domain-containing protein n=1 Tax=Cuscuta campestris TaxID=132261 RepID=A0A484MJN5_9ASTE|nr:unnamed protein product [Cuscuta campestris]
MSTPAVCTAPSRLLNLLRACISIRNLKQVHTHIICKGFEQDQVLISQFISISNLFSSNVAYATRVFERILHPNIYIWNTLIKVYCEHSSLAQSLSLLNQMKQISDVVPDGYTLTSLLRACSTVLALREGMAVHALVVRPDEFVMVSLMSACSQIGCLDLARRVDCYVMQSSFNLHQPHVAAALVDMNAKCGNMDRAMALFEEIPKRDVILYCSLMQALSVHGRSEEAVRLFDRMLSEGLVPDGVAFTVILTACSRGGLVEEGSRFVNSMINDYALVPSPDHYACIVDLLGRSGKLKAAYNLLLRAKPIEAYAGAWGALLGACQRHCDIELVAERK